MDKELKVSLMLLGFKEPEEYVGRVYIHKGIHSGLHLKLNDIWLFTYVEGKEHILELRAPYLVKAKENFICPQALLKVVTTLITDFNEKGSIEPTDTIFKIALLKIVTDKHNNVQESP